MFIDLSPSPAASWPRRLLASVLRTVLLVGGMLLMLGALLLGLVLASGVVLWALLRGRRPAPVNLRWGMMPRPPGFGMRPARSAGGEVVDAKVVREAEAPPQR